MFTIKQLTHANDMKMEKLENVIAEEYQEHTGKWKDRAPRQPVVICWKSLEWPDNLNDF